MISPTTLALADGVKVVVPDSLNLITPYVLREQGDWFEDEIKFLRRLLRPGDKVVDIGANYGVYTLSMAKAVGPQGRVWSFEPATSTAGLLAQSIAANGFSQIFLERSALSSESGVARLALNDNSELNALVRGAIPGTASEEVPVTTLDEAMTRYGWRDIAFVKIDAEGEEASILNGGTRFFAQESPLVQYEIKAGADLNFGLVQAFDALGYRSYRLVPGLDLLTPFDSSAAPDGFLLNLFCCRPDRAEQLAAAGRLITHGPQTVPHSLLAVDAYDLRNTLARLPYGVALAGLWSENAPGGMRTEVATALRLHAASRDVLRSAAERFAALNMSFELLRDLCAVDASRLRLASLARVACELGARALAAGALQHLGNDILQHNRVDLSEPFLAPIESFDSVAPGEALGNWILAAVLEAQERFGSYSSFYTGTSAWQRLHMIRTLGFGGAEMARRLNLVQQRFGLPAP